jgi:hypothetical protein
VHLTLFVGEQENSILVSARVHHKWPFMRRIENTASDFKNKSYDLEHDPDERKMLLQFPVKLVGTRRKLPE